MAKLLTKEELIELTGSDKVFMQRRVLEKNGIYFIDKNDGEIAVTWHAVYHPKAADRFSSNEPNFDAIE